ncbi:MAG: hypothetical protein AAF399_22985 [Bacteroidota bacterium]
MQLFQIICTPKRSLFAMALLMVGLCLSAIPSARSTALPQGGGGSIVLDDDMLRAISDYPDDPVIRIEVWRNGSLLHTETDCGDPSCSTDVSHLSSGACQVLGFTQGGGYFSDEIVLN